MVVQDFAEEVSGFAKSLLDIRWYMFKGKVPNYLKSMGFKYLTLFSRIVVLDDGTEYLICWTHNHGEIYSIQPDKSVKLLEHVKDTYSNTAFMKWVRAYLDQTKFTMIRKFTGMGPRFYIKCRTKG